MKILVALRKLNSMLSKAHKQIVIWLVTGCVLIAVMVVIGGITRLTESGLSITEWNVVSGTFPPMNTSDWQQLFDKYQQSPQYLKINTTMTLEEFKSIFWWEYIHRLLGRLIGVVFLLPFIYFLAKGWFKEKGFNQKIGILFFMGAFQGSLGWFMVASGLRDNPHVSHYRLAAHLITAFLVYGFTLWLALDLVYPRTSEATSNPARRKAIAAARLLFLLVTIQIIYGAFVAGLRAGAIYNTWPKMAEYWIPPGLNFLSPGWLNFFENQVTVQFIHRTLATLLVLMTGLLWFMSIPLTQKERRSLNLVLVAIAIQFLLGVLTLINGVPIALGVLHQLGALILFTTVVYLNHRLREMPNEV